MSLRVRRKKPGAYRLQVWKDGTWADVPGAEPDTVMTGTRQEMRDEITWRKDKGDTEKYQVIPR